MSADPVVSWAGLSRLRALADEAGAAILAHYHDGVAVERKADDSPLTAADRAAHGVLVAGLAAWTPAIPVVSEEGELPAAEVRAGWRRFWLVDPLDGTKEFLHRNGEFTVNIALVEDGAPVLGVVTAPALGVGYGGGRGLGAWRWEGTAAPRRIAARSVPPEGLTVVESRSHPSERLEAWLAARPVRERVGVGSSLKFCLVAEGRADCYPRLGPTMEWDVAAGDAVWRHATRGAPNPSPLTYNKADLRNGDFVIGSGGTD